jgi:ribose transport system permease protein
MALLAGAATGALCGLLNGVLTLYLKISSFIATLGTMIVLRGVTFLYCGGHALRGDMLAESLALNRFHLGFIAPRVVVMLVLVAVYAVLSGPMRWGLEVRAVGGDVQGARAAGIPVGRRVLQAFVLSGLAAGMAGGVQAVSLNSATPALGGTLLLPVLAAAVIGGTSLLGGKGSVAASLLGVLLLGTLSVGLNLLRVDSSVQQMVIGSLLLVMVVLDRVQTRRPARLPWRRAAAPAR